MSKQPLSVSIGAMAEAAGVNIETIRFYQRKGLLAIPKRPQGETRRYGLKDVARVKFVKAAQRLGFSLDEIASLLKLEDGTHCDEARAMAEHKLNDVRAKVFDLRRMETALEALIADCCATKGTVTCPLIAALQGEDGSI
jgi:MerR family mercuric resistance operon transcriptional regulator